MVQERGEGDDEWYMGGMRVVSVMSEGQLVSGMATACRMVVPLLNCLL